MTFKMFEKKPAFFPSVNAEVFFEAEDALQSGDLKLETSEGDLSTELDAILRMADDTGAPERRAEPASAAR